MILKNTLQHVCVITQGTEKWPPRKLASLKFVCVCVCGGGGGGCGGKLASFDFFGAHNHLQQFNFT